MTEWPPVIPLFDSVDQLEAGNASVNQYLTTVALQRVPDAAMLYEVAIDWLLEQRYSENNYKSYRSELTTFLHWAFDVEEISVADIDRRALNRYIEYCMAPPVELVHYRNVPQFKTDKHLNERLPNPLWRPFLARKEQGVEQPYRITDKALKTKLAILSSFFSYLIDIEYTERNPAMMLMKNGRFKQGQQRLISGEDDADIKAFSELQWSYVISAAEQLAESEPEVHERTLFMISLLYSCYLRISEIAARPGFAPSMGQFRRDSKTGVWGFHIPRSKGGKSRTVAVSDALLDALKRYRRFLALSALPTPREETPLFVRHRAASHGRDAGMRNANLGIRQLREQVYQLFQQAATLAEADGFDQDAREIGQMTPHSIRHTGISHDINLNQRPLSHVQADAGHDSIDTTSQYLHTSRVERHETAAAKPLDRLSASYN